jgi:hypothetical protein
MTCCQEKVSLALLFCERRSLLGACGNLCETASARFCKELWARLRVRSSGSFRRHLHVGGRAAKTTDTTGRFDDESR